MEITQFLILSGRGMRINLYSALLCTELSL